jgi:catalase
MSTRPRSAASTSRKIQPSTYLPLRYDGFFKLERHSYFAEIEQAAFSPGRTVPGWEPSADPVLQARLFSYGGTK